MTSLEKQLTEISERLARIEESTAEVLDTEGAARFLKIAPGTLRNLSRPGNMVIPVSKPGGVKKLYLKSDLLDYVNKMRAV